MLIRLGYDIGFNVPAPVTIVAMLHVHPSREPDLLEPDELKLDPGVPITNYIDTFGNRCSRFVAPPGQLKLSGSTLIQDSGDLDEVNWYAREQPVGADRRAGRRRPLLRPRIRADPLGRGPGGAAGEDGQAAGEHSLGPR